MHGVHRSAGLDFDDHSRSDDDISAVFADDLSVKRYFKRHLAFDGEARLPEENNKRVSVDPLGEAVA